MYRVLFTERALKDLKKIDKSHQVRIAIKLKEYAGNPFQYAKKLTDPKIGEYRFRVGDYRIIFDITDNEIIILRLGHRKNIYR